MRAKYAVEKHRLDIVAVESDVVAAMPREARVPLIGHTGAVV